MICDVFHECLLCVCAAAASVQSLLGGAATGSNSPVTIGDTPDSSTTITRGR